MAVLMMDEIHVQIVVPAKLPRTEYTAIKRCLNRPGFDAALRRAILATFRRYPSLHRTTIRVAR